MSEAPLPWRMSASCLSGICCPAGVPTNRSPISWALETKFKLPVKVWRDMIDSYYPNCVWLNLRRDVFDRLYQYKTQRGIPTWEQALEEMLPVEETVIS